MTKPKESPDWWEVRVPTPAASMEAISNFLFELGATGCQEEEHEVVAYFPGTTDLQELQRKLQVYLAELQMLRLLRRIPEVLAERIAEHDWAATWKKGLHPIRVSQRLVVKPSWTTYQTSAQEVVLEIDPKQAFGTGMHATTQLCLRMIDSLQGQVETVLDVGTGSGILAIAAAKLGATRVLGIDIDPVALEVAQENLERNAVADRVELRLARPGELPSEPFDLVVANLNRQVIEAELVPQLHRLTKPDSRLILSGLLRDDVEPLAPKLQGPGLALRYFESELEWVAMLLEWKSKGPGS